MVGHYLVAVRPRAQHSLTNLLGIARHMGLAYATYDFHVLHLRSSVVRPASAWQLRWIFRCCLLFDPTLSMSVIISWRSAMQWVRLVVGGATCQPGLEQVAKRSVVPSTIHRRTRASTSRNVRTSNTRQRHQRNIACMLRAMRPLIACLSSGWQKMRKGKLNIRKTIH